MRAWGRSKTSRGSSWREYVGVPFTHVSLARKRRGELEFESLFWWFLPNEEFEVLTSLEPFLEIFFKSFLEIKSHLIERFEPR